MSYGFNIIGTVGAEHTLPAFPFLNVAAGLSENYNNYSFYTLFWKQNDGATVVYYCAAP